MPTEDRPDGPAPDCALCRSRPSTPTGEHVLPRAVIRSLFPVTSGPFTTSGLGPDRVVQQFDSVKLPCCGPCNDTLAARFENPGQGPAVRLLSQEPPGLSAAEAERAALWVLKTWLLMVHPRARYQPSTPRPLPWDGSPDGLWSWTVDGGPPPNGLSAWAFRHVQTAAAGPPAAAAPVLALPTVHADGAVVRFRSLDLTLSLTNVALVHHRRLADLASGRGRPAGCPDLAIPAGGPVPACPPGPAGAFRGRPDHSVPAGRLEQTALPPLAPGQAPEVLALGVADGAQAAPSAAELPGR